ncbi:glycosyltransferase family 2 protein [Lacticaseibacillus mingshuiensis]|uniref:Glycosyltransferase family 2 protein n=1 Tax=Lacticaseibacillus mingshuiensis TaxID=2799574 RepID=A0ABW4CFC9_9LACO|nr:glycosyltransferase family 2 protein [Lacticaseibacillus mingshuiensis]
MMKRILISIPAYSEADNVVPLYNALKEGLKPVWAKYDFEFLYINDGSKDDTVAQVRSLMETAPEVSLLDLSRNYGKEIAMTAGFDYFHHDAMVTIDADLQMPVSTIVDMINLWEQGYEDVYAKRNKRMGESWLKKATSRWFYKTLQSVSHAPVVADAGDFRLLDKKVVAAICQLRESERYTKGLYSWVGFKKAQVEFDALPRLHGQTKWNFRKLFGLAMQGITSYTTAPLKVSTYSGFAISLAAFIYLLYVLIKTLLYGSDTSGFPTLVILILFIGGVQLISIGILGEYLGRIFNETKQRPLYFIEDIYHRSLDDNSAEEASSPKDNDLSSNHA